MIFFTTDFPNQNEKLKDFCASPVAKNRRVNARRNGSAECSALFTNVPPTVNVNSKKYYY